MIQESPTDARLDRLPEHSADLLGRLESPEATVDLLPDDWNRGARDHPGDHQGIWMVQGLK